MIAKPKHPSPPETNPSSESLIATYSVDTKQSEDPHAIAALISRHFYPGTSANVTGEQIAKREKHITRIVFVDEVSADENLSTSNTDMKRFEVQIVIPLTSIEPNLTMLLSAVAGELLAFGDIRLRDLRLPKRFINNFAGPKFGIPGIREILGIPERPLLLGIVKPSLGYLPAEGANVIRQAALGGADIIKDDELLANPSYCRRVERITLYKKAFQEAYEQTGEKTLYAVNISDSPDRIITNALEAIELGANALMINYLQAGLDSARMVCEDPRIKVPVLGHNAGASSQYLSRNTGMSTYLVNAKLPRLCGLDLCIFLTPYGKFQSSRKDCIQVVEEMRTQVDGIRQTLPIAAGGVTPALVGSLCSDYGLDIAIGVGGGIFGHPDSATAGAKAFRQAIQCIIEGRNLLEAAQEFGELNIAFKVWGAPNGLA